MTDSTDEVDYFDITLLEKRNRKKKKKLKIKEVVSWFEKEKKKDKYKDKCTVKIIYICFLLLFPLSLQAKEWTWQDFFYGLAQEESKGGKILEGDNGNSKGWYHIQRDYWNDAVKWALKKGFITSLDEWKYDEQVYNKSKSEQVMKWYWMRYCPVAYKNKNWEKMARCHNRGPSSKYQYDVYGTRYWKRICEHIKRKKQ